MKICTKCKAEKPKAEFSRQKKSKDGLRSNCKGCVREYYIANKDLILSKNRAYHAANREYIAEKHREWLEENKEDYSERRREWYADNKESVLAKVREYREENKEILAAKRREYYTANKDKIAVKVSAWRKANPDKIAAIQRNRRAKKRQSCGAHKAEDVKAIFDSQRGKCASCPKRLIESGKDRYHVDHIQPISKGGSNDKYNLQCLCPDCNKRKNAKDPLDWAREIGRLL